DNVLARASARWVPTETFTFNLAFDYTDGRSNGAPITHGGVLPSGLFLTLFNQLVAPMQGIAAPNGQPTYNASFAPADPLTNHSTASVRNTLETWGVTATAEWSLGAATIRSISAYRDLDTTFNRDGDASPFTFRENRVHDMAEQFSQEFQFTGALFQERLKWLLGGYYFNEKGLGALELNLASGVFAALEALPGPLPNGFGGRGNPRNISLDNDVTASNDVRNETYAAFTDVSFDVTDWLTLEAGLRQNWDDKEFSPVLLKIASNVYIAPPGSRFAASFTSFTPRFAVQVKPAEAILLYGSYAKGFKSGGFNGRPLTSIAEINQFEPEEVASYELGVKSEWFDRRLVINAAAFTSDYTNIQLLVVQPPANFVYNAGAGRIRGVEIETNARLFGALTFNGSLGYLDAEYSEVGQNVAPGQSVPITLSSKFIKTPKWTWSAGGQYDIGLASSGTLSLRADYSHKSGYFNDVSNSPQIYQPGFGLLSARASYTTP
ncbi:MAG: TonB-dependent receptor, partial [Steroidobacteraceae bacterium]